MENNIFWNAGYLVNIISFIAYIFFIKTTYIWKTSINNDHKWVIISHPLILWITLLLPIFIPYTGIIVYPIVYTVWINYLKETCWYSIRYSRKQSEIREMAVSIGKLIFYPFKVLFVKI
jgi:hypothetical protein